MTALLSIMLAGAAVPATPVEPGSWFTSKDNPKTAMMVAERGYVAYTIDVSPNGKAVRCETEQQDDLDRKVCDIMMKNARFTAAKDGEGRPAFGRHEGVASFLMPGKERPRPDRSKLTVTVDQLPAGVASPAFARVAFLVDGAGAISQCASMAGERRRFMQTVEALGPEACTAVAKEYKPVPVRDAAGTAVASVQIALVRFAVR